LIAIFTDVTWNGSGTITFTTLIAIFTDVTWNGSGSTKSGAEEPCYENLAISKNDDLGNQTREHNPDDYDLYENSTTIKIIKNVSGGKCNRSGDYKEDIYFLRFFLAV
jgi:hypothetical protein